MFRCVALSTVLVLATNCFAADLPKHSMQVIREEDGRKSVVLNQGDVLQVLLPNGSGNFAQDYTVDVGKSPLKLTRSLAVQFRDDDGNIAVGGGEIALFFDAVRPGSGELTISVSRMFDQGQKPLKLRITVKPPTE